MGIPTSPEVLYRLLDLNRITTSGIITQAGISIRIMASLKGGNALSVDPEMIDPANNDFRLGHDSPCLKSGDSGTNRGAYGPGLDGLIYRMRHGKFFAKDGDRIQMETLFRDHNLIGV